MCAPFQVWLFGAFDAQVHGRPLPPMRTRRGQRLLALLILRHGREVDRSWLAGTVWPDSSESDALRSLRQTLVDLRHALGEEAVRLTSPTARTLRLDLAGATADVVAFDDTVARGDAASLAEAISLYRGPLLEGWTEEWVVEPRQAREQAYLASLERLASKALAAADPAAAARALRRATAADPLRESAHRGLMEALAAGGDYAAATQVYRDLRLLLHRELNASPAPETTALYEALRAEARQRAADVKREIAGVNRQSSIVRCEASALEGGRAVIGEAPGRSDAIRNAREEPPAGSPRKFHV
jgi:DNA-binding SARP family transcriptional activator